MDILKGIFSSFQVGKGFNFAAQKMRLIGLSDRHVAQKINFIKRGLFSIRVEEPRIGSFLISARGLT